MTRKKWATLREEFVSTPEGQAAYEEAKQRLAAELADFDKNAVPANQRSVRPGGLMRCCTETLREDEDGSIIGTILRCKHCNDSMIVAPDGVWEWNNAWRSGEH